MADKALPHFLRFARALTLGSGLAVSGGIAIGCESTELTHSPGVIADAADDASVIFPGVKVMSDAGDAHLPFPGVKVMPSDGGGDDPIPSGGPLAAPDFVA